MKKQSIVAYIRMRLADQPSRLAKNSQGNLVYSYVPKTEKEFTSVHLYITQLSKTLKIGDWYIFNEELYQYNNPKDEMYMSNWEVIIATTDSSLGLKNRPSNIFLQTFAKMNGKINEIAVRVRDDGQIFLAPDNTITIWPVKKFKS